eukprot:TRINITY_DN17058_c0_g1_i1.p1 TRINITY_DN17058_c0_g1~~TRINITY_DN17058_c0_g1_i1.p1  ORF type:complete len:303 (+),score=68.62 TRINITY_DN17058_c0_g1_i1:92-1000(+)
MEEALELLDDLWPPAVVISFQTFIFYHQVRYLRRRFAIRFAAANEARAAARAEEQQLSAAQAELAQLAQQLEQVAESRRSTEESNKNTRALIRALELQLEVRSGEPLQSTPRGRSAADPPAGGPEAAVQSGGSQPFDPEIGTAGSVRARLTRAAAKCDAARLLLADHEAALAVEATRGVQLQRDYRSLKRRLEEGAQQGRPSPAGPTSSCEKIQALAELETFAAEQRTLARGAAQPRTQGNSPRSPREPAAAPQSGGQGGASGARQTPSPRSSQRGGDTSEGGSLPRLTPVTAAARRPPPSP